MNRICSYASPFRLIHQAVHSIKPNSQQFHSIRLKPPTTAALPQIVFGLQRLFKSSHPLTNFCRPTSTIGASLNVNTNLAKDILIFKYENPKFFRYMSIFAYSQFLFWSYLSHFAYTELRDIPVDTLDESASWWQKMNLGDKKSRIAVTGLCFLIGKCKSEGNSGTLVLFELNLSYLSVFIYRILNSGAVLAVHAAFGANASAAQGRPDGYDGHVRTVWQEPNHGRSSEMHFGAGFATNGQSDFAAETAGFSDVLHAGHEGRIQKHQTVRSNGRTKTTILNCRGRQIQYRYLKQVKYE